MEQCTVCIHPMSFEACVYDFTATQTQSNLLKLEITLFKFDVGYGATLINIKALSLFIRSGVTLPITN